MLGSLLQIYCSSQNIVICRTQNRGYYVACGTPYVIEFPCTAQELGSSIFKLMNVAQDKDLEVNKKFYIEATGIKSFKNFSSKYELITLSWPIRGKMLLSPWGRSVDGSYEPRTDISISEINLHASSYEIGRIVLNLVIKLLKLKIAGD